MVLGSEPIVDLAAVEHDFETAERRRDQREADPIDLQSAGQALLAFALEHLGLVDEPMHQRERSKPDRHVDEEDPVPGEIVGDPAAERRADGRRDDHGDAVEREGLAALFRRKGIGEDGLLAGRHAAAAEPLQDAEKDQRAAGSAPARRTASSP